MTGDRNYTEKQRRADRDIPEKTHLTQMKQEQRRTQPADNTHRTAANTPNHPIGHFHILRQGLITPENPQTFPNTISRPHTNKLTHRQDQSINHTQRIGTDLTHQTMRHFHPPSLTRSLLYPFSPSHTAVPRLLPFTITLSHLPNTLGIGHSPLEAYRETKSTGGNVTPLAETFP